MLHYFVKVTQHKAFKQTETNSTHPNCPQVNKTLAKVCTRPNEPMLDREAYGSSSHFLQYNIGKTNEEENNLFIMVN